MLKPFGRNKNQKKTQKTKTKTKIKNPTKTHFLIQSHTNYLILELMLDEYTFCICIYKLHIVLNESMVLLTLGQMT